MRCIIFDDNYQEAYQNELFEKYFRMIEYLKGVKIDFTFGLGSGQLFALNLVGAYDKISTQKIIEKRDDLIFKKSFPGVLARVSDLSDMELDLVIKSLESKSYIKKVDQFSEKTFLVSGELESISYFKNIAKIEILRKGALHTILAKDLIAPFAKFLRNYEIKPFNFPLINTRNTDLMKLSRVGQELVDSLTLPQNFYHSFRRVCLFGVCKFYFIGNKSYIDLPLKGEFPKVHIEQINNLEDLKEKLYKEE